MIQGIDYEGTAMELSADVAVLMRCCEAVLMGVRFLEAWQQRFVQYYNLHKASCQKDDRVDDAYYPFIIPWLVDTEFFGK